MDTLDLDKLDLVPADHPALTTPAEAFDFANPQVNPYNLAGALVRLLNKYKGIGIAAPQLGLNLRVFAHISPTGPEVCFNPEILDSSEATMIFREGCLTFPEFFVDIRRPIQVLFSFYTAQGLLQHRPYGELSARVVQHEVDHLDGILFQKRASKFHLDRAKKQFRQKQKRSAA